jgi:hypothetical protein
MGSIRQTTYLRLGKSTHAEARGYQPGPEIEPYAAIAGCTGDFSAGNLFQGFSHSSAKPHLVVG